MERLSILALGSVLIFFSLVVLLPRAWKANPPRNRISTTVIQKRIVTEIHTLADTHEVAAVLSELIRKDGAGSWPPRANHDNSTWPAPLRPYKDIYFELAPLLPQETASFDDKENSARIVDFRSRFQKLLNDRVDLAAVTELLQAVASGRWDLLPRDVYNAFYCCVASSRHAYRWATIPVVRAAQLERVVDLPAELAVPWAHLQRHFGCPSESGNNTSNLVLNFDADGRYVYKINTGMAPAITEGEEAFACIFYEVERSALPIYHDMVQATLAFARGDKPACARHMATISTQLRLVLSHYYDRLHDGEIPLAVWLSRVQGFYAWGAGIVDEASGEWDKFDGLSGNQILLFQLLDAFIGMEPYLSARDKERNVPALQRAAAEVFEKHSFRAQLSGPPKDEYEVKIIKEFAIIVKRLRLFRQAHRFRAKNYLSYPAPERLPMTAGKSLLKSGIDQSLQFLDEFMTRRLGQTV